MLVTSPSPRCVLACGNAIGAPSYPDRPVRLIVGFPPGGAADILGRIAAQRAEPDAPCQQVVVDNRGGAGGLIAHRNRRACESRRLHASLHFHPAGDQSAPLPQGHVRRRSGISRRSIQFVVGAAHDGVGTCASGESGEGSDRDRQSEARPDRLRLRGGSGSSSHLAMELFKSMAGVELVHVPYKGTGPMITDMLGGQIGLTIASAVPLTPQVKAGKLRGARCYGAEAFVRVSRPAGDRRDRARLRGRELVRHRRACGNSEIDCHSR